ncbi:hypothetical protein O4H49_04230 [Kiloniella laminariae]|uniref:Uncharacterized protein n=1 Tax=Kiloniella laminariae TaxID=454162 RepID=A0ABT4LFU6_9PROT|nr:hypothetical protein [Kiloniella laminariae]MCZ4279973.1 hypothetical protein [Kiloniella laminariae]
MKKSTHTEKPGANARFVSKAIGSTRAAKFLAVEGLTLSPKSSEALKKFKAAGLKGDPLRRAISAHFKAAKRA